jgi:very-short-patch-repair endonuclease
LWISYAVKQSWSSSLTAASTRKAHANAVRDAHIAEQGYRVVRFWNSDVFANREGVLTVILQELTGAPGE